MPATQLQIDTYITDIRSAIADYGNELAVKQMLGNTDTYCYRIKLILLSGYLDCISDYFLQYPDDVDPDTTNFFTKVEIRDVMQHINNITGSFYIINL